MNGSVLLILIAVVLTAIFVKVIETMVNFTFKSKEINKEPEEPTPVVPAKPSLKFTVLGLDYDTTPDCNGRYLKPVAHDLIHRARLLDLYLTTGEVITIAQYAHFSGRTAPQYLNEHTDFITHNKKCKEQTFDEIDFNDWTFKQNIAYLTDSLIVEVNPASIVKICKKAGVDTLSKVPKRKYTVVLLEVKKA